jgi:hypothetical protein
MHAKSMDSTPLLLPVLRALQAHGLEAILIGNAAAALHGAPVTTLDFDFMFRETPVNLRKLKAVARSLKAVVLRPYYPVSKLYRLMDEDLGLQVDFMPVIHGVRSFNSLRSRAARRTIDGVALMLASSGDIVTSRRSAARLRDAAVLPIRGKPCMKKKSAGKAKPKKTRKVPRAVQLAALREDSELQMLDLIRRRLDLPIEKRMNFLRRRLPGGGSCL